MKNVILFGYGKMGSSIAKGWKYQIIDFNIFIIETNIHLKTKL